MKKSIALVILIFTLVVAPVFVCLAPPPPPPGPPSTGPAKNETYIGGVPIASGMVILLALGLGYGARKYYNARKRRISE